MGLIHYYLQNEFNDNEVLLKLMGLWHDNQIFIRYLKKSIRM